MSRFWTHGYKEHRLSITSAALGRIVARIQFLYALLCYWTCVCIRVDVLTGLIKTLLPRGLHYTANHHNILGNTLYQESTSEIILTEGFFALLSAILERNGPKQEQSSSMAGTSTRIDSSYSRLSNPSACDFSTHSVASMETGSLYNMRENPKHRSVISIPRMDSEYTCTEIEEEDNEDGNMSDDALSDCSDLTAHLLMNLRKQFGSMCLFALIWSFGAYIPFQ